MCSAHDTAQAAVSLHRGGARPSPSEGIRLISAWLGGSRSRSQARWECHFAWNTVISAQRQAFCGNISLLAEATAVELAGAPASAPLARTRRRSTVAATAERSGRGPGPGVAKLHEPTWQQIQFACFWVPDRCAMCMLRRSYPRRRPTHVPPPTHMLPMHTPHTDCGPAASTFGINSWTLLVVIDRVNTV